MKKVSLIFSNVIIVISISLILFLRVNIYINKNKNEKFLETYNSIFRKQNLVFEQKLNLHKIEYNGTDYIGVINILKDDLLIPIQSKCNNSFISIKSVCNYSNEPFIILGTNLKDSFYSYKKYDINDIVVLTNTLGNTYQYRIKKIERIDNLNNINNYDEDLIIVIKNYYSLEYILFICELD